MSPRCGSKEFDEQQEKSKFTRLYNKGLEKIIPERKIAKTPFTTNIAATVQSVQDMPKIQAVGTRSQMKSGKREGQNRNLKQFMIMDNREEAINIEIQNSQTQTEKEEPTNIFQSQWRQSPDVEKPEDACFERTLQSIMHTNGSKTPTKNKL